MSQRRPFHRIFITLLRYLSKSSQLTVTKTHRHLSKIDCLTACTACLLCFISTVNGHSKKKKEKKAKNVALVAGT